LEGISNAIKKELEKRRFAYIPENLSGYFESKNPLFGEKAGVNFPSAEYDIKCAGNCMAAELYTAAVFHLVRVTTVAERALARSLGVTDIGGKKLEYCRDQAIIDAIEAAIENRMNAMGSVTRDEAWEIENAFYRRLKTDLEYFKEIVRDPVDHARKTYGDAGAKDVYDHVEGFMRRLAERVKE
jgi:hypothetical protein